MSKDWLEPELRAALEPLQEWQIVALVLYGEARSEPIEGLVAVANVLRNRVKRPSWWGSTYTEVATAKRQFSCLHPLDGERNYQQVLRVAQALAGNQPVVTAKGVPDQKYLTCAWTARGLVAGFLPENTKGSTHYHTAALTPRPNWAQDHVPVCQRGAHVFYAGVK
jgi:N-acetylmuramoyl-L-alanine amidase